MTDRVVGAAQHGSQRELGVASPECSTAFAPSCAQGAGLMGLSGPTRSYLTALESSPKSMKVTVIVTNLYSGLFCTVCIPGVISNLLVAG